VVFAANMTAAVAYLIAVEALIVIDVILRPGCLATGGIWAVISVLGVVMVIDVTIEMVGAVKPGTCTDEDPTGEPLQRQLGGPFDRPPREMHWILLRTSALLRRVRRFR
jgi:hypothetical protein